MEVQKFLKDQFGDPARCRAHLIAYGFRAPEENSVYKWFRRDSIPAEWLARLLAVLEIERGGPVSVSAYVTK